MLTVKVVGAYGVVEIPAGRRLVPAGEQDLDTSEHVI
jgi:hypothetical protein